MSIHHPQHPSILHVPGAHMRLPVVMEVTGNSKSQIYKLMATGAFPAQHKDPISHSVYWISDEILAWIKTRETKEVSNDFR